MINQWGDIAGMIDLTPHVNMSYVINQNLIEENEKSPCSGPAL